MCGAHLRKVMQPDAFMFLCTTYVSALVRISVFYDTEWLKLLYTCGLPLCFCHALSKARRYVRIAIILHVLELTLPGNYSLMLLCAAVYISLIMNPPVFRYGTS